MTTTTVTTAAPTSTLQQAAEDLRVLAWLQEVERPVATLQELYLSGFPAGLSLVAANHPQSQKMQSILHAMQSLQNSADAEMQILEEELAADYAAIYLNHTYRAAPCESVWLDEDNLILQAPTFAVREIYKQHGLQASNWRTLADDHICNELTFVAIMLERGILEQGVLEQAVPQCLQAAANFIQNHLMQWLPQFAKRVEERSATSYYACLAELTLIAVEQCATLLPAPEVPITAETAEAPVTGLPQGQKTIPIQAA